METVPPTLPLPAPAPTPEQAEREVPIGEATAPVPAGWVGRLFAPLRMRLILLVLLALLPVVGLVVGSSFSDRARAVTNARQDLLRIVHTVAQRQKEHIDGSRELLRKLATFGLLDPARAVWSQRLLRDLLSFQKSYADVGVADLAGNVKLRGQPEGAWWNVSNRHFFQAIITNVGNWKFVDTDYDLNRATGSAFLYVANPLTDRANELDGIIYAALSLNWIYQFVPQGNLLDGSTLTIIARDGDLLLRYPDPEKRWLRETLADTPELARLLMRSKEGSGEGMGRDGVRYLYGFTPLSSTGGFADAWVVAALPATEVQADAHLVLINNLTFLGFIGVLALSAAWFGGDIFVLQPVRTLARATHSIRGGDFQVRAGLTHAPAELAGLAQDFEAMAESLAQRIAERERAEAELRQANESLERRVEERTQELKRSNEDLEQFAYVASHDLQEPLRMISSYMQLLKQRYHDQLDSNAHEFIGFATDGAQRMQRLITDLLTYSRVGTRQRPMLPTDTNEVVERAVLDLKVTIEQSAARVTHDPLPVVLGDTVQLSQLFQNLIGNAIKFRGETRPEVHLSARRVPAPAPSPAGVRDGWEFTVGDNGIGIAAEHFERIFIIFQRLHNRGKYAGTGIGLAICKKIVERHGGRIWVSSEPGHGAQFHFTLPAAN